jgi:ATP-dependent DNA ligase
MSRVQFIPPALAKLRPSPPTGDGWLFELKFDGWRVQLHKAGVSSTIYGRYAERTIMWSAPLRNLRPALFSTV